MRTAARAGVALAVLVAALVLLFPTAAVVRRLVVRLTPPGLPPPAFAEAHLWPGGLRLSGVTLSRPEGRVVVTAEHVDLRPSLWGLVTGRRGHPWAVDAAVCGGSADGTITDEGAATVLDVEFRDADLAACPLLELGGAALTGRAAGSMHLRLDPSAPPHGNGQLTLTDVLWRGQGVLAIFRANSASGNWRLERQKLTLASLDVRLPALVVRGAGEVQLTEPLADSDLRLALTLTPADEGEPPRPVLIGGTLGRPRLAGQ